jgi:hypothetical protein
MGRYERATGYRLQARRVKRASGFGLRASGFGLRASGFGLRASGFGLRILNLKPVACSL